MHAKAFATGVRIEHPQSMVNLSQYGKESVEGLGAAAYKLTANLPSGRGVYTFCMCPGGYVVNASSEERSRYSSMRISAKTSPPPDREQ